MSDIPELDALLSKRVRVYLNHGGGVLAEGEMIGYYDHPSLCIRQDDGTQTAVSSQLRREVVDPLPPQPPVGAPLMASFKAGPPALLWREERGYVAQGEQRYYTWAELHEVARDVVRLIPADEQPQEKYEQARHGNGWLYWQHGCGFVGSFDGHPAPCGVCGERAGWFRVYRRSSDG